MDSPTYPPPPSAGTSQYEERLRVLESRVPQLESLLKALQDENRMLRQQLTLVRSSPQP